MGTFIELFLLLAPNSCFYIILQLRSSIKKRTGCSNHARWPFRVVPFDGFVLDLPGMPVRLIIFDLDGTLVDSIEDITNALNFGFEEYGMPPLATAEVAGMVGEGSVRLVEKVIERNNLGADKRTVIKRFADYYGSHIADYTKPYPGVSEALQEMAHCRKAVVSNKLEVFSKETLDRLGLSKYFDIVVGGDGTPERKPSPIPVQHVLSTLGVKPEETIIVGDSEIDIKTGKAASVKTVAVTYGYGRPGFEKEADFVIKNLSELVDIVKNMA